MSTSNSYGPNARENSEMISILIGVIDPTYISLEKREQMLLAELGGSGVKTHRKRQAVRRVGGNGGTDYQFRAAQAAGVSSANF